MHTKSLHDLSDCDLLTATSRALTDERRATVELIALLAELDARRLYLGQGCASLFTFCTQVLHLSEHAAYHRIEAARAIRQFPSILDGLIDGSLTLTTVALLRPHLTRENHERLLTEARHKAKREVEHQIACLAPQPDVRPVIRKVAAAPVVETETLKLAAPAVDPPTALPRPTPVTVAPLSADRYVLKVTIGTEAHAALRRAQDLLRHTIPNGDPSLILERALALLVAELERTRVARTSRPRATIPTRSESRHVPAQVRRAVWARDQGRCAFEGPRGRCRETGQLEFHHLIPFARGGATTVANLALRCRAHNAYEGEQAFGTRRAPA